MESLSPIQKTLEEILATEEFDRLHPFKEGSSWLTMTEQERELLATLFVTQGTKQLKKGDTKALESFDLAVKIAPSSPTIHYKQAVAYSSQHNNIRCLNAAHRSLQTCIALNPQYLEAWCAWGSTLVRIGLFHGDSRYFEEADEKFLEADKLAVDASSQKRAECYWQWGFSWYCHGKQGGEAHDYRIAIEKYRKSAEWGLQHPDFWNHYGDTIAELAILIGRKELFIEAMERYRNAVKLAPDQYRGWLNLACSCQRIFEYNRDEVYFNFANESFMRAAELKVDEVELWLNWGLLFSFSGKCRGAIEHFHTSFEKFAKANTCEPDHPVVLSRWAEALKLCGVCSERVDLLKEAEAKIVKGLELYPNNAHMWCIYGNCLTELGRYFGESAFFDQAIEKFKYGISLEQYSPLLWHGLSLAYFACGELRHDVQMLEQSVRYCAKVMECGGQSWPPFWNDWGVALMKLAEFNNDQSAVEAAIEKFERAINRPSEDGAEREGCELEWLYNYGCALDFLGDFTDDAQYHEKAVQVLAQVVQQDPTYLHARYNLALALSHLGDLTDDIEYLQRASEQFQILLQHDTEDETAWNDWGVTLLHLALRLHDPLHPDQSQKLYAQAEEKFQHAVALGNASAFYNLACLNSLTGHYPLAMHYLERVEAAGALPPLEDILHDEWLDGVRHTSDFRHFINLITDKDKPTS